MRGRLLYLPTPSAFVGLVVEDGVVVDAPPAAQWARGVKVSDLPRSSITTERMASCHHICVVGTEEGLQCRLCKVHLTPQGMILSDQQDDIDWGPAAGPDTAYDNPMTDYSVGETSSASPSFPEYPDNPHEHRYTITMKGGVGYDAPWVVVHASTAAECIGSLKELEAYGFYPALGSAQRSLRAVSPGRAAAPAPAPAPMAGPPMGGPQMPNQPYPGQPAWQQAGAPQQQWGGGGQQQYGGQQGNKPDPSPQPPGWWKINARTGPGFDNWKAMREQQKDFVKGKIKWAGGPDYWVEPSLGQWLGQQGWATSQ